MGTIGKIKTLFSDVNKTKALFPRTKIKAVSDDDGTGLDAILEDIIYTGEVGEAAVVPVNADTLGGRPANDYATENFVKTKIAEAQLEGEEVDLSGFATKDDISDAVRAIDFPVDSVNGKTGAITLSASDVGSLALTAIRRAFSNIDENGTVVNIGKTSYPTEPGVFRVTSTVFDGLPVGCAGYGTLLIFNGGSYCMHFYLDHKKRLYYVRTEGGNGYTVTAPSSDDWSILYSSDNKPTPADFGAVNKNGDTMSGWLTVPRLVTKGAGGWILNTFVDEDGSERGGVYNDNKGCTAVYARHPNANGSEFFSFPCADANRTSNKYFNVLTDKNPVSIAQGGTGVTSMKEYLENMFPVKAAPTYIPVFGDGWESRGYALPSELMTAMGAASSTHKHSASDVNSGTLPIERGGTGADDASKARDNLGFPWFRTYYFESDSMLNALKNNYGSIANGICMVYAKTSGSFVAAVGYKVDNYAAFHELWYGDDSLFKYRNVNGTWSQCYYTHGG